ncbi:MAG TPA: hypothetical protein DHV03_07535 [Alphaproteobacteria bacterium]|nr:hypothetical protein [Alphaproteobacteria bacterium]
MVEQNSLWPRQLMTLKIQRLFNPETKALILSDHGHNPWNELVKAHAQQQGITPSTAEAIISVRGKDKYVVMSFEQYSHLRICELEAAIHETRKDLAEGRFVSESPADHLRRIEAT